MNEIIGGWRELHNEELHNSYNFYFHWLYSPLGPWPLLFSFMIILQTVGLLE
jgi:hypothetical protein